MSIKFKLNPQENEANLLEQIRIFELALGRAKAEGRSIDIERYERTLATFREELKRLEANKTQN